MRYKLQVERLVDLTPEEIEKRDRLNTMNQGFRNTNEFLGNFNERGTLIATTELSNEQWERVRSAILKEAN